MKDENPVDDNFTFYINPKIDFFIPAYLGEIPVPTKQDSFKGVDMIETKETGEEEILKIFYIKNPESNLIITFNQHIQEVAKKLFSESNMIKKPHEVEVILSISVTEKRYKTVDVDNLAKAVLDSLNGIAFEDDSQVSSLIVKKHIHPMKTNGILIGITKLTEERNGLLGNLKLIQNTKWE